MLLPMVARIQEPIWIHPQSATRFFFDQVDERNGGDQAYNTEAKPKNFKRCEDPLKFWQVNNVNLEVAVSE